MSAMTAYLIQPDRKEPPILWVIDDEKGPHSFELSLQTVARINAESADILRVAVGGVDFKRAAEELAQLWARQNEDHA